MGVFDSDGLFLVVVNHEEQYSIWPVGYELPEGWTIVGKPQSRSDCMAEIERLWSDMRPLSLRKHEDLSHDDQ